MNAANWRASPSYVTGAQSMKFGYQGAFLYRQPHSYTNELQTCSTGEQRRTGPDHAEDQHSRDTRSASASTRLYAQEQWTRGRMTLQGACGTTTRGAITSSSMWGRPGSSRRAVVYPAHAGGEGYTTSRRVGLAYDLFGNGKTAIKVNMGKYLEAAENGGIWSAPNPTGIASRPRRPDRGRMGTRTTCRLRSAQSSAQQELRATGGDICGA